MDRLPVSLHIRDRAVIVIGGGETAARKIRLVRKAGGLVTVVAPLVTAEIAGLAAAGALVHRPHVFTPADLDVAPAPDVAGAAVACNRESSGAREACVPGACVRGSCARGSCEWCRAPVAMVIAATGRAAVDEAVAAAAMQRRLPVNAVDRPDISGFTFPAIVDRDPVVVSVATDGTAPVLARQVRGRIEQWLPPGFGRLARFASRFRPAVAARLPPAARRHFWEDVFSGPVADLILRGEERAAHEQIMRRLNTDRDSGQDPGDGCHVPGRVYIVGAGPGDPDLLTLRAFRALQTADVIVHDRLIGPQILDYARRDALRLDVGKAPGGAPESQARINRTMADHARAGQIVVRLKGGDPLVFGRGAEERDYLQRQGIEAEIVPGVTAATAAAADGGISLTARGVAAGVTFVTGHRQAGADPVNWRALVEAGTTLVVYMGVAAAGRIRERLGEAGMADDMPVAIVSDASRPEVGVIPGRLADLPRLVTAVRPGAPAVLVIGTVAGRAVARQWLQARLQQAG